MLIVPRILVDALEVGALVLWIQTGIWWLLAVGMVAAIALAVGGFFFYIRRTAYLCPACHDVFVPSAGQVFWVSHTLRTRRG